MKSTTLIHPVAFGSYSIQASSNPWTSSPATTPEFSCLAYSRPSITAAILKLRISQEMSTRKEMK
jgi:hypothetical protein